MVQSQTPVPSPASPQPLFRLEVREEIFHPEKKQTNEQKAKNKASCTFQRDLRKTWTLAGPFHCPKGRMVAHAHQQFLHSLSWSTEQRPQLLIQMPLNSPPHTTYCTKSLWFLKQATIFTLHKLRCDPSHILGALPYVTSHTLHSPGSNTLSKSQ